MAYIIGNVAKNVVKWLKKYYSLLPDFNNAIKTITTNPTQRPPCKHLKQDLHLMLVGTNHHNRCNLCHRVPLGRPGRPKKQRVLKSRYTPKSDQSPGQSLLLFCLFSPLYIDEAGLCLVRSIFCQKSFPFATAFWHRQRKLGQPGIHRAWCTGVLS